MKPGFLGVGVVFAAWLVAFAPDAWAMKSVCDRTEEVKLRIMQQSFAKGKTCSQITLADLKTIQGFTLSNSFRDIGGPYCSPSVTLDPSDLEGLDEVRKLSLYDNSCTGFMTLPDGLLSSFPKLEILRIGYFPNLAKLGWDKASPSLRILDMFLGYGDTSAVGFSWMKVLTNPQALEELSIDFPENPDLPSSLPALKGLKKLTIGFPKLTHDGSIARLFAGPLPKLESLNIRHIDSFHLNLEMTPALQTLQIDSHEGSPKFSGEFPPSTTIDVGYSPPKSDFSASLSGQKRLRSLSINFHRGTTELSLKDNPLLETLEVSPVYDNFSYNHLSLEGLASLRSVELHSCYHYDRIRLANIPALERLHCSDASTLESAPTRIQLEGPLSAFALDLRHTRFSLSNLAPGAGAFLGSLSLDDNNLEAIADSDISRFFSEISPAFTTLSLCDNTLNLATIKSLVKHQPTTGSVKVLVGGHHEVCQPL